MTIRQPVQKILLELSKQEMLGEYFEISRSGPSWTHRNHRLV